MEKPEEVPQPLDRHALIQEFRRVLRTTDYQLPIETEAVVVLSGHPPEQSSRVEFGAEMIREIVAKKTGKPAQSVNREDILSFAPPLVLNGEPWQLEIMQGKALDTGFPQEKIELVDSGEPGKSNTKTQFEAMRDDPRFREMKDLIFITTGYHVPRAQRTATQQLPEDVEVSVIPVPYEKYKFNIFLVRGEIKRIINYAQKGDILLFPRGGKSESP